MKIKTIDEIEDINDYLLAAERIKANKGKKTINIESFWKEFDIDDFDVDDSDVEFE